ncbi:hypothetical protein Val02_85310 [Virgisporangium aliadipatigenens]|uniref:DUF6602 domain-containing protein n=1 Tax=Virgisporangium aliadipatigenens TaxID=741659 RepID=A0A8J3YXL4_9ACTN|nr:DUF6602 domain-containing protein [Virgisporangium aliadipatigenens]GIJ51645.1 hypothetical protein Val02_85310 [Virgisporangium aliadipatigenens]
MDIGPGGDPADQSPSAVYELVQKWNQRLTESLSDARTKLIHRGSKGDVNEIAFRNFLREYLPRRYRVGEGEVIDFRGRRSKQTDVAVVDDDQPFPMDDGPQMMIIEAVAASGEVKTTLTASELEDCIEKGRAFKALEPVLGKAVMLAHPERRGVPNSDITRFYRRRPFFVFAYEGVMAPRTLLEGLAGGEQDGEVPPIDAVFILDRGFALNLWDGNGSFSYLDTVSNEMKTGWIFGSRPELSLPWLLFWLHGAMPQFSVRSSPMLPYLLPGIQWTETNPPGSGNV